MVYITVKVDKTHQMQENLKKVSSKHVKIERKVYYMFCRFTVHETFESNYPNVKLIDIYDMLFNCFSSQNTSFYRATNWIIPNPIETNSI